MTQNEFKALREMHRDARRARVHGAAKRAFRTLVVEIAICGAVITAAAWLTGCVPTCTPKPTTPPDTTVVEVEGPPLNVPVTPVDDAPGCPAACANVERMGCSGWAPEGETCAQGCPRAVEAMGEGVDLKCVARATSCEAASGCIR